MSQATLEELKERQRKIAVKIREKEAELKRAERRKRAHILIQCGAVIFSEATMKANGWNLSDIEEAMKDPARFRTMILKALGPLTTGKTETVRQEFKQPTATATARPAVPGTVVDSGNRTVKAQPAGQSGSSPVRQSVQTQPHK